MGFGSSSDSEQWPAYTGVQLNVAVNTMPVPILWGAGKLGTNLIEYVNFSGHKSSSGGKGGGKGGGLDYSASLELALCEGLVDSIPLVLVNTNQQETLSQLNMTLIPGTYPEQEPWSYMVTNFPGSAYGYPGTAIVAVENYDLGESASVPNQNMLTVRLSLNTQNDNYFRATWCTPNAIQTTVYPIIDAAFSIWDGIPTADMALVIQDMLTNAQYGVPCFPATSIDTASLLSPGNQPILDTSGHDIVDTSGNPIVNVPADGDGSLQTYLRALGIGMAPVLDSAETASSILDRWMQVCNCAAYWGTNLSGCALKFVPYGDETISGNGVVYVPNLPVVYDLDDDDYLGDASQDPVQITRTDFNDAYNVVRVEVTSADGFFAYLPVEARDQNAIEISGGPRIMPTVTAHEIVGVEVGAIIAQLILQQGLYWRNTATFKLDQTMCLLEPMDMVTLTDANLGLIQTPYRVLSIEEDDNGELTLTAQEFRQGVSTAQLYSKQVSTSSVPNPSVAATNVNTPVIFEPTSELVSSAQIWMAVCGGQIVANVNGFDPNWGGCNIWVSVDNDNYEQIGSINGPSRMGILSAILPTYSGANPDNTNTLTVDLSESAGVLSSGSLSDAQAGRTLCYVDGELISYVTATLIDATATNESHAVPQVAPFEVAVKYTNTFLTNISVSDGLITFTEVSSNPGTHQYAIIAPGVYEFNGPYAGALLFSYTYGNPYHYALTGLERGMYGTTISAHPANAEFARLDVAIFEFDLPNQYVGIPLYIKLPSVNVFGLGAQTLADVSAFEYTPTGAGLPGGIVKTGKYTATSADATAGTITIATGLAVVSVFQVTITRGTVTVTGDAKVMSSGANIIIANGPSTYTITTGDVINWLATGATQLPALLDTSGNIIKDISGNTIFTL